MAITPIPITYTHDQWRQRCNEIIDSVNDIINNTAVADMITLIDPVNEGDILVWNDVDSVFNNASFEVTVQDYLTAQNIKPSSNAKAYYMSTLNNIV